MVVTVLVEALGKKIVCQFSCLLESIYSVVDLEIGPPVVHIFQ